MPSADHAEAVERHIATYGETLTHRKPSAGTYNPATRTVTGETVTETAIVGFVAPFRQSDVDGDAIRIGDLQVRISGAALATAGLVIDQGDYLERDGTRYRVESVDDRGASGTHLMAIVHLRGSE